MNYKQKPVDAILEKFASYKEAIIFSDTYNTAHYTNEFETVEAEDQIKRRRYEFEIGADLMPEISDQAHKRR